MGGGAVLLALTPFAAQAQTCANGSQTPLTKSRLDQIATSQGISLSTVGLKFEDFALKTIRPGNEVRKNGIKFSSPERLQKVGILNVVPDGAVPLTVAIVPPFINTSYPNAVFYEAKAVKGTLLPPSYEQYQILGFLDVLGRNPAVRAGENPAIVFMTTSDIRKISTKTVAMATEKKIGVWHSIACEVGAVSGNLQLGEAVVRNPGVYIQTGRFPIGYGGPGSIGRI